MVSPPDPLELLGKRVRYLGREGLVVGRLDPRRSSRDRLAPFREASVTIRFEGPLGPTFVEVEGAELASIELLD
jgi:hypothetical protein